MITQSVITFHVTSSDLKFIKELQSLGREPSNLQTAVEHAEASAHMRDHAPAYELHRCIHIIGY